MTALGSYMAPFIPGGFSNWLDHCFRESLRAGYGIPNVTYSDATFGRVPVRIFAGKQEGENSAKRPAIVFFHGGGWAYGNIGESQSHFWVLFWWHWKSVGLQDLFCCPMIDGCILVYSAPEGGFETPHTCPPQILQINRTFAHSKGLGVRSAGA